MSDREDLLICTACGTQFDVPASKPLNACRICDVFHPPPISRLNPETDHVQDPRQFVPPTGQTWTSLAQMHGHYKNVWKQDEVEKRMWSITTEPKFSIGQRCVLLQTGHGNVLWDCITYLDEETTDFIHEKGGLKAIVISHPHYYTTHLEWARIFDCPVYLAEDDKEWLCQSDSEGWRRFLKNDVEEIISGVTAAKPGGHFIGSLVLCWDKKLFVADTLVTVPSALYHINRPPGTTSYAFMWSIPNMIPLSPAQMLHMWRVLERLEFASTHGAFVGTEVRDPKVKGRVLESMKIQARGEGYVEHELLKEEWI